MIKFFRHIRLRLITQASSDKVRQRMIKENQYCISWLDYTNDIRKWEANKFRFLVERIEELQQLMDEELSQERSQ